MLVKGNELPANLKAQVLNAYIYRWTVENQRVSEVYANISCPTMEKVSDAEWLAAHAFHVTKAGKLDSRRRHCEPAYLAN